MMRMQVRLGDIDEAVRDHARAISPPPIPGAAVSAARVRLEGERFRVPTSKGWAVARAEKRARVLAAQVLEGAAARYERQRGRAGLDLQDGINWALYAGQGGIDERGLVQGLALRVCEVCWVYIDAIVAAGVWSVAEVLETAALCARSELGE